uniref:AAA family ATPase n=2 Tax=Clostridiaceae TaxID=31979 RepID=UPI00189E3DE9
MAELIIIRGNSGSGKTTLARKLQRKFGRNTMVISQDVIRRDMLMEKDGFDTKALPLLIELLKYGRRNCEVTILEGILNSEWYKPLFETAI